MDVLCSGPMESRNYCTALYSTGLYEKVLLTRWGRGGRGESDLVMKGLFAGSLFVLIGCWWNIVEPEG